MKRKLFSRGESGLSLIEAMVAMTVLAFASSAIFIFFDDSWKQFKRGESAIEVQQTVRAAFDKISLDVQMAGFNYNPDGDLARPDEQVEAAFDTAIVIRADFDAQDAVLFDTPENTLTGSFDIVSTGNDEIVAYVLAKPDGSSTGTLTFLADVANIPRDGVVESISIPNVALVQNDPPYTLYRITLKNDPATMGSDFFVRTVYAENVQSLSFRYFDDLGNQLNSGFDLTSTSDDIGGTETAAKKIERGRIDRIELDLVGLTPAPDMRWIDPLDSDPDTQAFRKFRLRGDVTPRNRNLIGYVDLN